jgi:putative flippase GtrA
VLVRELSAFGVVGAACFVLDLALFQLLYASVGLGAVTAKLVAALVAALVSMTVAFVGRVRSLPVRQESVLALQVSNVASIAIGTAVRWPTSRRWVFPALQTSARTHDSTASA